MNFVYTLTYSIIVIDGVSMKINTTTRTVKREDLSKVINSIHEIGGAIQEIKING